MTLHRRRQALALRQALDEARFGSERTLNLRLSLPTGDEAARRAEAWLRERQATRAGEVLIITGRGRGSVDGVPVVREAVTKRLASLKRRGVVAEVQEHTPGSFVVRLAPMTALLEAPRRRRERESRPAPDPAALEGLEAETRSLLRRLARLALDEIGVRDVSPPFVEDEMLRQFTALAAGVPDGPNRESRLRAAIARALEDYEEER